MQAASQTASGQTHATEGKRPVAHASSPAGSGGVPPPVFILQPLGRWHHQSAHCAAFPPGGTSRLYGGQAARHHSTMPVRRRTSRRLPPSKREDRRTTGGLASNHSRATLIGLGFWSFLGLWVLDFELSIPLSSPNRFRFRQGFGRDARPGARQFIAGK